MYIYIYTYHIYMHMMYIYIIILAKILNIILIHDGNSQNALSKNGVPPNPMVTDQKLCRWIPMFFYSLMMFMVGGKKKWRLGLKNEILKFFFILLLMFAHFWTSPPRIASQRVQEGYFCNLIWFHLTGSIWTSYPNGYPKYIERTTSLAMSGFPCSFPKSGVIKSWVSKISTPVSNQKSCFGLVPNGLPRRDFQTQIWTPRISTGKIYLRNRTLVLCSLTVKKNHVLDKRMNHSVIGVGHKSH